MVKSCVNKCRLDKQTNKCTGCDRTIEEIKSNYSDTKASQKILDHKLKSMANVELA